MDNRSEEIFISFLTNPTFRGLNEQQILGLIPLVKEFTYQAGDFISHEGEIAEYLYIIKSGKVEIVKENLLDDTLHVIATLDAGDIIGELSLIENSPHAARSASIKAATHSELYALLINDLRSTQIDIHTHNAIIVNLAQLLCRRLRLSNEAIMLCKMHKK